MASVHKDRKGYRLIWREDGRRCSKAYPSKSEAMAGKRATEERLKAVERLRPGQRLTLRQLVARWLESRPQTYRRHDEMAMDLLMENHPTWRQPADIDRDGLLALPIGQYRLLIAALRYGAHLGQAVPDAILQAKRPPRARKPAPDLLSDDQVAAAQAAADRWGPCYGLAVHLISHYGHRPASMVACTIDSLDMESRRLTLPVKGGDTHRHPVLAETIDRWKGAAGERGPSEPILLHSGGEPWKNSTGLTSWYFHHIGKVHHPADPGIYALKRWAIVRMLDNGIDARTVASITGHRTPSLLLDTYSRTREDRQTMALAAISGRKVPQSSAEKS